MSRDIEMSRIENLALFGGRPLFDGPKPTSNLVRPEAERFFHYVDRMGEQDGDSLLEELEQRLAAMHAVSYCVALNSGFWALALLIDALHIPGRKQVVLPSLTYRRMADIVAWVGLTPHFCDIDRRTLANSAKTVATCLNDNTALIIGVHPVGSHCDIDGLMGLAKANGVAVIFDSVESTHELYKGRRIGAFGDAELFSLGASKLINGFEGGYITTNSPRLAADLRRKRNGHGTGLSLSVALPDIHIAMALASLDGLQDQLKRNLARFDRYRKELADIPELRLIEQDPAAEPSHKNIVIEVLDEWPLSRDQTLRLLNAENILARAYYAPPLTQRPMSYDYIASPMPNTDWVAQRFISLPCGHLVTLDDIGLITSYFRHLKRYAGGILARISLDPLAADSQ